MTRPVVRGIHHLKVAVSTLDRSLGFYERALGAARVPEYDHRDADGSLFAYLLEVPGLGTLLELRLDPERAERHRGFDAMTLTVRDRAELAAWQEVFEAGDVPHSPILQGIQGWLIVVEDPDGNRFRLYTEETHGPELKPELDSPWL